MSRITIAIKVIITNRTCCFVKDICILKLTRNIIKLARNVFNNIYVIIQSVSHQRVALLLGFSLKIFKEILHHTSSSIRELCWFLEYWITSFRLFCSLILRLWVESLRLDTLISFGVKVSCTLRCIIPWSATEKCIESWLCLRLLYFI